MLWEHDEVFDYVDSENNKIEVAWNLDNADIEITRVYLDVDTSISGDDFWEFDNELAEDISSYIQYEFLDSEDFWMSKTGYNF